MAELYSGQCTRSSHWATGLHVVINVLSTILLGASNYVMQCLGAPSRTDIDQAHSKSRWLDIGTFSLRNFAVMGIRRKILWLLLLISSTPIHMVYNSAVFSSISTFDYGVFMIPNDLSPTESLVNDVNTNSSKAFQSHVGSDATVVREQIFNGSFTNTTIADCLAKYNVEFNTQYSTLIFVADREYFHNTSSLRGMNMRGLNSPYSIYNDLQEHPYGLVNWTMNRWYWSYRVPFYWFDNPVQIVLPSHCLIKEEEQRCQLFFSLPLAIVVIICNATKAVCMLLAARVKRRDLLLTVGDALASFLTRPDSTTRGRCLLSRAEIARGPQAWSFPAATFGPLKGYALQQQPPVPTSHPLESPSAVPEIHPSLLPQRKRWYQAASWNRWAVVLFFFISCIITTIYLFSRAIIAAESFKSAMDLGFGQTSADNMIKYLSTNMIALVLLANTPQIVLSVLYFLTNSTLTCMLVAAEWDRYARHRRPLRVSWPRGQQRSTYYLSLPYRYSIPLLVLSATLHWLLSQSIFFVSIKTYPVDKAEVPGPSSRGCCYSPMAMFITLWGVILALGLLLGIGTRRFGSHMPLATHCSAAISATCHPPDGDEGAAQKPVIWGEIPRQVTTEYTGADAALEDDAEVSHCSFTSLDAVTPSSGRFY
ncbi:hypothetical protein P170DRAFT_389378, partial [Aspergillus steynii IBT 23096]